MERTYAAMAGAVALVLVASGCSEQSGPAPFRGPHEGTRITQRWTEHILARDTAGIILAEQERSGTREAVVAAGIASTSDHRTLATIFRSGEPVTELAFHDSVSGEDLLIRLDRSGDGPVTRIRTFIDGALLTDVGRAWDDQGELWVLAAEQATITATGGSVVVDGYAEDVVVQQASAPRRAGFRLQELASAVLPARLEAETACWSEYRAYILATVALALASNAVLANPYNPQAFYTWTIAFEAWRMTYDRVTACLARSGGRVF